MERTVARTSKASRSSLSGRYSRIVADTAVSVCPRNTRAASSCTLVRAQDGARPASAHYTIMLIPGVATTPVARRRTLIDCSDLDATGSHCAGVIRDRDGGKEA